MLRPRYGLLCLALIALLLAPPTVAQDRDAPSLQQRDDAATLSTRRPVATYSIVARDSATGDPDEEVQANFPGLGAVVSVVQLVL